MSRPYSKSRSYLSINKEDLSRLAQIARIDREDFFANYPKWAELYMDRVLCVALCQGAAQHYIDGTTGINDFDVWTFYRMNPNKSWCYRRTVSYDFGNSKFGVSTGWEDFVGRRVDCLGRDIEALESDDAISALRRYLEGGKTQTARLLAQKAVVLLEPHLGEIIWPSE